MKRVPLIAAIVLLVVLIFVFWKRPKPENQSPPETSAPFVFPEAPGYTTKPASRDGTGKFYLGREIAHVMGHPAIKWLERDHREDEENPSKAVELLSLKEDEIIADIGAGSGYYTFLLAPLIPKGKVIAVDIQQEMINFLENRKEQAGLSNIESHLGKIDDTKLPPESIDSALMVDSYHEFSHPYEMMKSLVKALKPGGRIFLLEYRAEDLTVPIKPLHKMSEAQAKKEMAAVGLTWETTHHNLPWQHLMIFRKP